jgi:hypothetical protein
MPVGFCSGTVLQVDMDEISYDDLKIENVHKMVL